MKRNAIVTGSNGGIGRAVIEELAHSGFNIWACMRNGNDETLHFFEQIANSNDIMITPVYFDVTDTNTLKKEIKNILKSKESIDVLVNVAGISHGGLFQATPINTIKEVFEINLFSYMEITQLVLKAMYRQRNGSIINVASIAGIDLKPGNSAYGVSKAAVIAWTKTLAAEVGGFNIRVNAVAPGLTDTRMASNMEKKAGNEMIDESAMKRLANPYEIAKVITFLASENSSFVNGEVIRIDGGKI